MAKKNTRKDNTNQRKKIFIKIKLKKYTNMNIHDKHS